MSLKRWFESPLGQVILEQQCPLIEAVLSENTPGTTLVVSPAGELLLNCQESPEALLIQLCPGKRNLSYGVNPGFSPLLADLDAIPLNDNSVDFVILHHALEFSPNPHQVLREITRILSPGGNLVIVGFNPWSLIGLRRATSYLTGATAPWAHHSLSVSRLIDWMHLMSCEPGGVARGFYGLPVQYRRGMKFIARLDSLLSQSVLPGGGFYMLHASKRLFGRSGQKPRLERAREMISISVASPAARNSKPRLRLVDKADPS